MTTFVTIQPGQWGIDCTIKPDPALLASRGVKFAALYLKYWDSAYVARLHAVGIAVIPIWETTETAGAGGFPLGTTHGLLAVQACQRLSIPAGTPIIFTADTGDWSVEYVKYFQAAEIQARANHYGNAGYMSRNAFDACMAAGVTFDIIWAWGAAGVGGGRHPDAHVNQYIGVVAGCDISGFGDVDTNVCKRPFSAWLPLPDPVTPIPTSNPSEEDDEMTSATLWRDLRYANAFLVNGDVCTVDDLTYANLVARGVPVVTNAHDQMLIGCMRKAQMKMAQMVGVGGVPQTFVPPDDLK